MTVTQGTGRGSTAVETMAARPPHSAESDTPSGRSAANRSAANRSAANRSPAAAPSGSSQAISIAVAGELAGTGELVGAENPVETGTSAGAEGASAGTGLPGVALTGALVVMSLFHLLIDTVAGVIQPLWPMMETRFGLQDRIFWVYLVWSMTTSFGQLLIGFLADRFPSRWLIWATPLLAAVGMSTLGWSTSPWILTGTLLLTGLAIAAFHPEAAATAGACFPEHRSRAMSVFALSGYLGQAVGPYYSGLVTTRGGLVALSGVLVWGLAVGGILCLVARGVRWPRAVTSPQPLTFAVLRGRWPVIGLLISVGVLRVLAALAVPLALAFLMDARGSSPADIGWVQSAFMLGIGSGAVACAALVRGSAERWALWLFPLLAAPLVLILPACGSWTWLVTVAAGFCVGITLPLLISYGQRLLPEGQRTASSLTMGVTWGLGAALLAGLMWLLRSWDRVAWSLPLIACGLVCSAVLALTLPRRT